MGKDGDPEKLYHGWTTEKNWTKMKYIRYKISNLNTIKQTYGAK